MTHELSGQVGELRATVTITRKATGKVETYELVGCVDAEKLKALQDAGTLPKPEVKHERNP